MNFEFSDESAQLREQARRYLAEHCDRARVRAVLEGVAPYDGALWRGMAELGWLGAAIPERFGGAGLGHEALCVLAEELGRALAPVPFSSSICLAAEAIALFGSPEQRAAWLPKLAAGAVIGCFAWAEGLGEPGTHRLRTRLAAGRLDGVKLPVADGTIASLAVVACDAGGQTGLALCDLTGPGVGRETLASLDPTRDQARLRFDGAPAEQLAEGDRAALHRLLNGAAVLTAFEQIGGAAACLDMAVGYARERHAFGRPIGSFQAIKHKLADVYVANELARSNAYYGCWALAADRPELPLAAATARVSACEAFHLAAKENIQTHGGMGFTWEADCHLFYRRAKMLALTLGSAASWKERVVAELEASNAA